MLLVALGQKKMFTRPIPALLHLCLYAAFIITQIELLEDIYQLYNTDKDYKKYPIIMYHGYHQRRIGCFNAGYMGLYINTDGNLNACPFCHSIENNGNYNIKEQINHIVERGCIEYGAIEL